MRARLRWRRSAPKRCASAALLGAIAISLGPLAGCATNPVTGASELRLVAESQEISIGEANYASSRQLQGGDFTTDPKLVVYVQEVGRRLAKASDRPSLPYEFAVLNSAVPNAWALPGGKIAINRGLLEQLDNEAQLAAVLGHEVIHAAARHGAKSMERGLLLQGAIVATAVGTSDTRHQDLAVGAAALSAQLLGQKYGRSAELESDHYGMITMQRAGYDPRAAVALQEIFVGLSGERRTSWLEGLFASHPPSAARVAANRETAAELLATGPPGQLHEARFADATRLLREHQAAYAALERGRAALATGDTATALREAESALATLPAESRFHGLSGAALFASGRPEAATAAYDRAIELDPGYFDFYLQRGRTLEEAGLMDRARSDYETSLGLLPTLLAHAKLGNFAEARGNTSLASQHYLAIAGTKTDLGREAAQSLARIELPKKPSQYLRVRKGVDQQNMLVIEIENRAPIAARAISIEVSRLDMNGRPVRTTRFDLEEEIAPGTSISKRTDLGPFYTHDQLDTVLVEVVAARPG